jgi:hypothetical protein
LTDVMSPPPRRWAMIPPERVEALSDCCAQISRVEFSDGAPRAAKRGLDTVFFATPNDHDGDAVPTGAGDHG